MLMIGIIGGSGFYQIPGLVIKENRRIKTPFGDPSGEYLIAEFSGRKIVFLPRHGLQHRVPPHKVNYRANIWGFKELGVERIISIGAAGGMNSEMIPGTIVIPDQIVDMTNGRSYTFYDSDEVVHIDFTEPYCPELRDSIFRAGEEGEIALKKSGTYICVNGPRLETRAEIQIFSSMGIDIVGMTAMPEASLAREMELCLAGIVVITNYAAGITKKRLTTTEVKVMMKEATQRVQGLLRGAIQYVPIERSCICKDALKEARM